MLPYFGAELGSGAELGAGTALGRNTSIIRLYLVNRNSDFESKVAVGGPKVLTSSGSMDSPFATTQSDS